MTHKLLYELDQVQLLMLLHGSCMALAWLFLHMFGLSHPKHPVCGPARWDSAHGPVGDILKFVQKALQEEVSHSKRIEVILSYCFVRSEDLQLDKGWPFLRFPILQFFLA